MDLFITESSRDSGFTVGRTDDWQATTRGALNPVYKVCTGPESALAFAPSVFSSSALGLLPLLKRSSRAPRFYAVLSRQVRARLLSRSFLLALLRVTLSPRTRSREKIRKILCKRIVSKNTRCFSRNNNNTSWLHKVHNVIRKARLSEKNDYVL